MGESPLLQSQYLQQVSMASVVRPAMLQKTCLSAASKRAFSTKLSSSFPAINKPSSTVSRKVVRNAFAKDVPGAMRVAAFHASGRQSILPPLPQVIQGTANDPAPVPPANPCIIDYIPTHRLPKTRKAAWWALRAGTVLAAVGFYEFETNDVGVTEGLKRIWAA